MAKNGVEHDEYLLVEQASTPSTPAAGFMKVYAKTDQKIYSLDSSGTETAIS